MLSDRKREEINAVDGMSFIYGYFEMEEGEEGIDGELYSLSSSAAAAIGARTKLESEKRFTVNQILFILSFLLC